MKLTIRQKIVARDDRTVFILSGHDLAGSEIYCVLSVAIDRLEPCLEALNRDGFEPAAWGEVLVHGIGRPSDFQLNGIKERFGLVE